MLIPGFCLRVFFYIRGVQPMLESAFELVVPSASWERAQEGLLLLHSGMSPYSGGVFTGSPLILAVVQLCKGLQGLGGQWTAIFVFAFLDTLCGLLLRSICARVVEEESTSWEKELEEWMPDDAKPGFSPQEPAGDAWTTRVTAAGLPDAVLAAYLLNPVSIGQCVALSGDISGRFFLLATLFCAQSGWPAWCAVALAAGASFWRIHTAVLLVPAVLITAQDETGGSPCQLRKEGDMGAQGFYLHSFSLPARELLCVSGMFLAWLGVFSGASWLWTLRSWAFLRSAAGVQLMCEDLTPNVGLYWYFFTEIFPRFRLFFRVLFLSHPYVYVLPATIRLGMFPDVLAHLLLAVFGIFQTYPTFGDLMLSACLFMCHPNTTSRMRLVVPLALIGTVPCILLPAMRHVWLRAGTGNANFYYFQTVIFNVLHSVFVLQFMAAAVKRRKALANALARRERERTGAKGGGG
ncbi:unnamed protein product, partial [Discosporangium mesarthrocarpum]